MFFLVCVCVYWGSAHTGPYMFYKCLLNKFMLFQPCSLSLGCGQLDRLQGRIVDLVGTTMGCFFLDLSDKNGTSMIIVIPIMIPIRSLLVGGWATHPRHVG